MGKAEAVGSKLMRFIRILEGVANLTGAKSDSVSYSQLVGPTCGGLSAVAVKYERVEASAWAGELSTALGWTI